MRAAELLERHPESWRGATRHPFLDAVREGDLPAEAFETWLAQDYHFVADLLVFQSRLLAWAPRRDQAVLAGGLVAAEAELTWFEEQARERGLNLEAQRHPTTDQYREFLVELEGEPYVAGIAALWTLELAYLEGWRSAAPGHPDYREFVEHWTTPEFADYVSGLEAAADAALAPGDEEGRAKKAFLEAARLEEAFWEMALPRGRGGGG